MRLLLLSNSRNAGMEYLEHAESPLCDFLGGSVQTVAFIPYAGVTVTEHDYTATVRSRFDELGYELVSVHEVKFPVALIESADAVAVGGGNTFRLLQRLREAGLIEPIRSRVRLGLPYVGWSAGSNVTCPTICTTNDMPIVDPGGFEALDLVPFQINPHYLDAHPEGHQGETREQRILEFVTLHPTRAVVGLREGSILSVKGRHIDLLGDRSMRVFRGAADPIEIGPGEDLAFLWEE